MTQVATSAADSDRSDVIAERLITVSTASMTARPSERQTCCRHRDDHPAVRLFGIGFAGVMTCLLICAREAALLRITD